MRQKLNRDMLNELFWYDPVVCQLRWKVRPHSRSRVDVNSIAGCISPMGYRRIGIGKTQYFAHQLIWVMEIGELPAGMMIDHVDGDRDNNDLCNLRLATKHENQYNAKIPCTNKSGIKNVRFLASKNRWLVNFRIANGQRLQRKFRKKEDAIAFAEQTREKLHGEFVNHGVHRCDQR